VSVGFYPARDYLPLVEFGVIRSCRSKAIILTYKQVYTLAQCLPAVADVMSKEGEEVETPVIKCESNKFRLGMWKRRRGFTVTLLCTCCRTLARSTEHICVCTS